MTPSDRLDSWKEIAAYLQRDVRTVQRWEALESLPVHRHQHKKRGSVYALRGELDFWRDSRRAELFESPDPERAQCDTVPEAPPAGPARRWWRPLSGAALLAVAAVAVALLLRKAGDTPATPNAIYEAKRLFGAATREGGAIDRIAIPATGHDLALSPDGRTLYVAYCEPPIGGIQAIDLNTRKPIWTLDHLQICPRMVQPPNGDSLYFADGGQVAVVGVNGPTVRRINTNAARLFELAASPDNRRVYAAASFDGVLEIDTVSGAVTSISKLPCPTHVTLSPGGDRLYVAYQCGGPGGARGHDSIEVIDTRTRGTVAVIKGLPNVGGNLIVSPDGSHLWADGSDACTQPSYDHTGCPPGEGAIVNVVRTADNMLIRSLRIGPKGEFNTRLSPLSDGHRMVIGNFRTTVLNTATLVEVEASPMPLSSNVVFAPDGATAYAVIGDLRTVAILPLDAMAAAPVGLTGRWTMDGTTSDGAAANNFADVSPEAFVPGHYGLAVRPDSVAALRIAEATNLDIDTGFATISTWFKADAGAATPMTIIEYGALNDAPRGFRINRQPDGRLAACINFEDGSCGEGRSVLITGKSPSTPGEWHHVALTRDGQDVTLYLDGATEAAGRTGPATIALGHGWLRLGSSEFDSIRFAGLLDEVEIYRRPLAAAEIHARSR